MWARLAPYGVGYRYYVSTPLRDVDEMGLT
jgi:hypothetical protein